MKMRYRAPEEEWVYSYDSETNSFTCNICGQKIPSTRKKGGISDPRGGSEDLDKHLWKEHRITFWNHAKGRPYKPSTASVRGNPTTSPRGIKEEEVAVLKGLLVPVGIGTALIVGYAVLVQAFAFGRRINQDGQYQVSVRYPGQWHDLRQFVQPDNPDVIAVYSQIGPGVWGSLQWVCSEIDYRRDWGEFFQWPSETIARRGGDCEDSAILLTSLIRAGGIPNAYAALGEYQGWGHAWVISEGGEILEATYTNARHVPHPQDYCPYIYFNDQEVIELWPGALDEVFELGRNEELKLELMAKTLEAVA